MHNPVNFINPFLGNLIVVVGGDGDQGQGEEILTGSFLPRLPYTFIQNALFVATGPDGKNKVSDQIQVSIDLHIAPKVYKTHFVEALWAPQCSLWLPHPMSHSHIGPGLQGPQDQIHPDNPIIK